MHDEGNEVSLGGNSSSASAGGLLRNLVNDGISNNFHCSSVGELLKIDEDVDHPNNDEHLIKTKVRGSINQIIFGFKNSKD